MFPIRACFFDGSTSVNFSKPGKKKYSHDPRVICLKITDIFIFENRDLLFDDLPLNINHFNRGESSYRLGIYLFPLCIYTCHLQKFCILKSTVIRINKKERVTHLPSTCYIYKTCMYYILK
jgi:hypothetical protein